MRVGQPRWRLPATCSTACWTWDARTTSASPEHVGAGVSAAAPLIPAPRWQMFVGGRWIEVPSERIQYRSLPGDTGETGGGHWCGLAYEPSVGPMYVTRCAILPPQSGSIEYDPM